MKRPIPAPFFVFRTPLLPFNAFQSWGDGLTAPGASIDHLQSALSEDRQVLRARLRAQIELPIVREALFLASPDLVRALPNWLETPDSEKGLRVERSLVKYFSRMCARPTPFGLFAGCSTGRVAPGENASLCIENASGYIRHTRPDMDYLCSLTGALIADRSLRVHLRFHTNTSLTKAAGRLHYAEARLRNKFRAYHLVAVDSTDYLQAILEKAREGAEFMDLANLLVEPEIGIEEATEFIHELIDSQLLLSDLEPSVTGPEPIHGLIDQLQGLDHPLAKTTVAGLSKLRCSLESIDASPLGVEPTKYFDMAEALKALPVKVELNRLFQADMVKPAPKAVIGSAVIEEFTRTIETLHALTGRSRKTTLSAFMEAFQQRYEAQEMPLLQVLDEEHGIGFDSTRTAAAEASPLLEGLAFPGGESEGTAQWSAREVFLLGKLHGMHMEEETPVLSLSEADLDRMKGGKVLPLPGSFSVMGELISSSPEALANGDFSVLFHGASGPSGANLLGRFCHGDPELTALVKAHLETEEAQEPDSVFAEIVHLPEGRIGNVILRPTLRRYEIPFLGRSGADPEFQIPPDDLMVSVREGRIVLRSRKMGREIKPRLTNAHNYQARSLGVYRFLCSLAHQDSSSGLSWNWGALESAPRLPRVMIGKTIVSLGKWGIEKAELKEITEAKGIERFQKLQQWRKTRRLPRLTLLADGDNKLLVDLDNTLSADTFLELIKGRSRFLLEEFFPDPKDLPAGGLEGRFTHELIMPFIQPKEVRPIRHEATAFPGPGQRSFPPGSDWLYLKLYTGIGSVDHLLRNVVRELLEETQREGLADGWFFIRYGDPDWHLRLRFRGDPQRLLSDLLPRIHKRCEPHLSSGRIHRMVLDTYVREVERYGFGTAMNLAEEIFQADSEAVLDLLHEYPGDGFADLRWRLAAKGMDLLLEDLGFDLEGKQRVMGGIRSSFAEEFRLKNSYEHQLGDRFRKERKSLEELLLGRLDPNLEVGVRILQARSERLAPIMKKLQAMIEEKALSLPLESFAASLLHMHANRLLRSAQRPQEAVLYDFLFRVYDSRLARIQKAKRDSSCPESN